MVRETAQQLRALALTENSVLIPSTHIAHGNQCLLLTSWAPGTQEVTYIYTGKHSTHKQKYSMQQEAEISEVEASLVYITNSSPARATQ